MRASKTTPKASPKPAPKEVTHKESQQTRMRPEIFLVYCLALGLLTIDMSLEYRAVRPANQAELQQVLENCRTYYTHNNSPQGLILIVISPLLYGATLIFTLYRLFRERKLLDVLNCVVIGGGLFLYSPLAPLGGKLNGLAAEELRSTLIQMFEGHLLLFAMILTAIIIHLFASPPSPHCRFEVPLLWVGVGMLVLTLSFDLPVMLDWPNANLQVAFVNNSAHLATWCHQIVLPSLFGVFGVASFIRALGKNWKDILSFVLFAVTTAGFQLGVEPMEYKLRDGGKPDRELLKLLGLGHLGLLVSCLVVTILSWSAQSDALAKAKTD